jgi:tetratricopeptide (TPR) repeat protein
MKLRNIVVMALAFLLSAAVFTKAQSAVAPEAIDQLTKSIQAEPANPELYIRRATAYAEQKRYTLAQADATKFIELVTALDWPAKEKDRYLGEAYYFRGGIFRIQGKSNEAMNDFNSASKVSANGHLEAAVGRVEILLEQGKEISTEDYNRVYSYMRSLLWFLYLGDRAFKAGSYNDALNHYYTYMTNGGDSKLGNLRRIKAWCKKGDTESVKSAIAYSRDADGNANNPCKQLK